MDYTIANTNPVILTAAGRQPNIFFEGVAKAILATSAGTQILVRDPVGDTAESFGNPWISSKRYSANDVVQGSDGQYYVSLINGNVNLNPVTTTGNWTFLYSVEWNAGTTYKEGSVITYQTLLYQSLQSTNLNRNPVTETTYWVIINLAYVSTVTYTAGQNVVGPDGVFYTALRTTIGDTPASSPSDWVGTSAAAAASATAAAASATSAAASASTATTQASNASTSAATATTQATNAAASAATATTQASNASTSASNASTSATNAAASASTASTQASNASTSATSAASSATSATASASTATTQASNASTSASNASTSASNASTSETNAAASASTATTQATAASSSASAASTSASNASNSAAAASSSASAASTSASNASTSAAAALVSENNSTSSANASAASAAAAAAIVNISSVTTFTNPLARAVQVSITAATSASNGIQQLTNVQNNFGTGNFALQWRGSVPDWTPAADVILLNKHDGTNGYILTLLTTGILRTTINGTNYDSTVATGMADGYVAVIDVDITRSSASAAGSVVYTLNGVILGASVAITATGDTTTELLANGDFATDTVWTKGTGWTIAAGVASFTATGSAAGLSQPIAFVAGRVYTVTVTLTRVAGSIQLMRFEGGTAVGTTTVSASGTYTQYLTAVTGNVTFVINAGSTFTGTVDNVSLKSILLTVDNTSSLYVCGTSAVRSASQWFIHRLFNFAKTASENLTMFVNGVPAAYVGASQTNAVSNPDAEGGVTTGWAANNTGGAIAVNSTSPISGTYDFLVTSAAANYGVRTDVLSMVTGAKYRLKFKYRAAAGSWNVRVNNGNAYNNTAGYGPIGLTEDGTVQTFSVEFTASAGGADLHFYDSSAGSTTLYLDDVSFVRIGITSELLAQNAQTDNGQVLDSSGNKQHALLPVAGATVLPQPYNFQVRWANTWAGTSELQYLAGVNQAILSANAVIDEVLAEISGTAVDGTLGDGVDADRYATIAGNTGLITGANFLALAAKTTDGTNRKLTWTPSAAFTGTIKFTVRGYVRD